MIIVAKARFRQIPQQSSKQAKAVTSHKNAVTANSVLYLYLEILSYKFRPVMGIIGVL
jgi:hypothetical protein